MKPMYLVAIMICLLAVNIVTAEVLEDGFRSPPNSAKPSTWWDWMHDLVTKEGITYDLEWLDRTGFGSTTMMFIGEVDSGFNPKHNMPGAVRMTTPEWYELVGYAMDECARLGLTINSFNGTGWSHSGGPWVKPEQAVQHIASSTLDLSGPGKNISIILEGTTKTIVSAENQEESQNAINDGCVLGVNKMTLAAADDYTSDIAIMAFPKEKNPLKPHDIIDLSSKVKNGELIWDVPKGKWVVQRLMMRNSGARTRVPPSGVQGWECDKLDKDAVKAQFDGMIGNFIKLRPQLAGKTLIGTQADSWEVGHPEWSPTFAQEFAKRRGYDPIPWMAAQKAQGVLESKALMDRFNYDYTQTKIEVFSDNFFSYMKELCNAHGMEFFTEAYCGPFDPITAGGRSDRPMAEFWKGLGSSQTTRWAAAAGHTYGRPIISAESFTSRWDAGIFREHPYLLKRIGDRAFCNGINEITIHGMVHQPWSDRCKPGLTMGKWGIFLGPNQTWEKPAKAWAEYLARCQFMLREGRFQADILQLMPLTSWDRQVLDGTHQLYNYDICSEETLANDLIFEKGRFRLPVGMDYGVLILPENTSVYKPKLLKKLVQLVQAGGTIIVQGPAPDTAPGLEGYPQSDAEVKKYAALLWGDMDNIKVCENQIGKGRVLWMNPGENVWDVESNGIRRMREKREPLHTPFWGNPAITVKWSPEFLDLLKNMGLEPDVEVRAFDGKTPEGRAPYGLRGLTQEEFGIRAGEDVFTWIHRKTEDADIYFIASQVSTPVQAEIAFRIQGLQPELFLPDTGDTGPLLSWQEEEGKTTIPLSFDPFESKFIVFRKPSPAVYVTAIHRNGILRTSPMMMDKSFCVDESGEFVLTFNNGQKKKFSIKVASPVTIEGDWKVNFPLMTGEMVKTQMPLGPWNKNPDENIRYFSGTAVYHKIFEHTGMDDGNYLILDLGEVASLAEVFLNGKKLASLWKPPFRVDITDTIREGANHLEIHVSNTWANRIIGDAQKPSQLEWASRNNKKKLRGYSLSAIPDWVWNDSPRPDSGQHTFATWRHNDNLKESPLEVSGLLGPVRLVTRKNLSK